jgi:hypothetical protein
MDLNVIVRVGMDWVNTTQDSDKLGFVNNRIIINYVFDKIKVMSWLALKLTDCQR